MPTPNPKTFEEIVEWQRNHMPIPPPTDEEMRDPVKVRDALTLLCRLVAQAVMEQMVPPMDRYYGGKQNGTKNALADGWNACRTEMLRRAKEMGYGD